LIITKNTKKWLYIELDNDNILTCKKYRVFFCILSPNIKDPVEAIKLYRNRDKVEKSFDDLKKSLDTKRLRVHTSFRMESHTFLQFLSLIYETKIRLMLEDCPTSLKYSIVNEILDDLEILLKPN
jgi:transposase